MCCCLHLVLCLVVSVDLQPQGEQVLCTCVMLSSSDLGKKHFFVNSAILGVQIWRKKCVNYNKFEIATNSVNLNAFLLTIYLAFTYFALCIDYEDDILFALSRIQIGKKKFEIWWKI